MVYKNCPIMLPNRVTYDDLVELHTVYFDVTSETTWLHTCFSSIDYRRRVVKFNFPNELVLEFKGEIVLVEVVSFLVRKILR